MLLVLYQGEGPDASKTLSFHDGRGELCLSPRDRREAAIADSPFVSADHVTHVAPVEDANFVHLGIPYCWYPNGWRGAGFYQCGFAWRTGFGWGGPWGWNGWGGGWRSGWNGHGWHRGMTVHHHHHHHRPAIGPATETIGPVTGTTVPATAIIGRVTGTTAPATETTVRATATIAPVMAAIARVTAVVPEGAAEVVPAAAAVTGLAAAAETGGAGTGAAAAADNGVGRSCRASRRS